MKIALLGPISTAGISPFLSESPPADFPAGTSGAPLMNTLIGALLERGHEVIAITNGGWAKRDNKPVSLKGDKFEFYCAPVRRHSVRPRNGHIGRILDFYAYERRAFVELLTATKPDFVHAHWTYEFGMAAIDSGLPYLITAHDDPVAVLKLFKNGYRFGRYLMARSVLKRATALSAVSDDLRNRLADMVSIPIEVIPNPLNLNFIQATPQRQAPSTFKEHRFISVMNGWGYWKNASSALLAFAQIRNQRQDVSYHLFGVDFERDGPAQRWAVSKGVDNGVVFHGLVPHAQLIEELKKASVMLHPSRWEACPMGIAEALALGLPVVGGSDSGGTAWMIGEGGLAVDITRPEEIAAAAQRLISDDALYLNCSRLAKERVLEFLPEKVMNQYEDMYRNILKHENLNLKGALQP